MKAYPVPTRVAVEAPGMRLGAYVERIDDDHVWIHVSGDEYLPERTSVRLTFRLEAGPSLGIAGTIVHAGVDGVGVRIRGPIDRAILAAWKMGNDADVSPARHVFTSETPTANLPHVPAAGTEVVLRRSPRVRDTLQDFVFSLPPA